MTDTSANEDPVLESQDEDLFDPNLDMSGYVPLYVRRQALNQMISGFPEQIKNRIKALKKLQFKSTVLEAAFYKEVHELECKYQQQYCILQEKRGEIVSGLYEPTSEESDYALGPANEPHDKHRDIKLYEQAKSKICTNTPMTTTTVGIPDFWLQIFRNVFLLHEMIQEHDEPVLKHLIDVKVIYLQDPMGFVLEFHFSPNDYFTNSVLTKEYKMRCEPKENDPFSFEGPEIIECKGCKIDWVKGKNLTMKIIRKKQKHKSRDSLRTITKQVPNDSFFNFFSPPIPDADGEEDEDLQQLLSSDYEIAHYIRERVIPRAVLYYTGEGIEEEEDDDDDDEEEEEEEEDEDGDSFDDDIPVKAKKIMKRNENPECKQQ